MTLKLLRLSCVVLVLTTFLAGMGISQVSQAEALPMFGVRFAVADTDFAGLDNTASSTANGFGVTLGVAKPSYRVYADLNFYSWDEVSTRTIHANYDYVWRAKEPWQVFTGVYGGLVDLQLEAGDSYQSGPSAGVQAGLLFPLGASGWRVETGVRYGAFSAKQLNPETNKEVKIKTQAEGFISLYFSS